MGIKPSEKGKTSKEARVKFLIEHDKKEFK